MDVGEKEIRSALKLLALDEKRDQEQKDMDVEEQEVPVALKLILIPDEQKHEQEQKQKEQQQKQEQEQEDMDVEEKKVPVPLKLRSIPDEQKREQEQKQKEPQKREQEDKQKREQRNKPFEQRRTTWGSVYLKRTSGQMLDQTPEKKKQEQEQMQMHEQAKKAIQTDMRANQYRFLKENAKYAKLCGVEEEDSEVEKEAPDEEEEEEEEWEWEGEEDEKQGDEEKDEEEDEEEKKQEWQICMRSGMQEQCLQQFFCGWSTEYPRMQCASWECRNKASADCTYGMCNNHCNVQARLNGWPLCERHNLPWQRWQDELPRPKRARRTRGRESRILYIQRRNRRWSLWK